jgi:hypothetical protein
MNRIATPALGRRYRAAHHPAAALARAADQPHGLLHGRRQDLRHGGNGCHRARHRCRADGVGRGVPDPALPARLCPRRGPCLAGTGAGDPWRRSCWCRSPHGQGCAFLPGHVYAKSALDIALWDITGQVAGLPIHALMGGRRQETLPLYHSITCVEPDEMARIAREAQATGITQFQAKLGASGDWQTDVERLARVREAVGPGPLVYGDWNCGAMTLDAIRVGRAVAHLDVMLEQPCATLEDCARVQSATGLPMKLDELAHDTATLLEAHRLGIMDAVALKLSKFGGLSATRRARDLCLHLGRQDVHRMHLGQRYCHRRCPASWGCDTGQPDSECLRSVGLCQPAPCTRRANASQWPHRAARWCWSWHRD